jgi:hypothetical protein
MKKLIPLAVVALVAWAGSMGRSYATLATQKEAKVAGVTAANCQACHAEKLPKKGAMTLNEKGKWLVAEKDKRKAKEIDGAWLKDYKEKK